jgi:hypothetical protein
LIVELFVTDKLFWMQIKFKLIERVFDKSPADLVITTIPTVKIFPNILIDNFIVKVLNKILTQIASFSRDLKE